MVLGGADEGEGIHVADAKFQDRHARRQQNESGREVTARLA
jgi:hypothetical protein